MKNFKHFLLLMLLSAATVVGCNEDKTTPVVDDKPQISLSAEGLSVKLDGNDVERTFKITSSAAITKDITVTVSTSAAATDATILSPTVVIAAGETTATGKIKFLGSAFPIGAAAKNINVLIASDENATVADGKNEIMYEVKGADKPLELPNATIICEITEVFVSGENAEVPVTIKLDKPAEQYSEFALAYGSENTVKAGAWTSIYPISIDEGLDKVTFKLVFDKTVFIEGVKGVSHLILTSKNAKVDANQTIKINVEGAKSNEATLSTDGLEVVVGDGDFSKTMTVTLAEEARVNTVFNLVVEGKDGDFEIVDKTITVNKGEKTGTGVIKFLKKAFPIELMTGEAIVSITTSTSGVTIGKPDKLLLKIKGTGTAPTGKISIEGSDVVKVEGGVDKTVEFTINLSEAISKAANFTITATSDKDGSFTLNNTTVTINQGAQQAKGSITFKAASFVYDTDKANVKLSIASEDVIVINSGSSIDFKVSGKAINPDKEDIRYTFEGTTKKTIYIGDTGESPQSLFFVNEGRNRYNTKVNNIYPEITGGTEGIDYEIDGTFPIVIQPTSGGPGPYSYININILPAAAGKILKVELFCDEATIGTNNIMELEIIYIQWTPTTRSAPRVKNSSDAGNYAIKMPEIKIGGDTYTHTYPQKEWNDLYEKKSFNVVRGDNTIALSAFVISESYYLTRTSMVVFADFNNDGDFSDPGEEIVSKKLEGLAIGESNIKDFSATMNVPQDAASEFAIRIGIFVNSDPKIFKNGYFVEPGNEVVLRMSDFKAVVQ